MLIARQRLRLHTVLLSLLFGGAVLPALALPPAGASGSSGDDSPSANTTPPPARPYQAPPLNGVYFPVLHTANLASSTGLADTPTGVVAAQAGVTGTGVINFPAIDVTKPWRAAILITMGEAPGNTNGLTVFLTNPSKPQNGYYIQLGGNASLGNTASAAITYSMSLTYGVLSAVPTGTRMWLSIASDGKDIWPCLIPDTLSTTHFLYGNYNHAWDGGPYCGSEGAQYVSSTNGAQTLGLSQIKIQSGSTLDVVNGVYLSEGSLDGPSDRVFFPPMFLSPDTGLDNNGDTHAPVSSAGGTLPYTTQIFVPGGYGQPGGTPVVLANHPYGNVTPPPSASPTLAALYDDGYMIAIPFAWAGGGGDSNYINALTSNNGAPTGLLLRKKAVDWIRQNLPFSWQLYQFGTSMGCNNALEYEHWWPGNAAILCVSGSTSLTVASSPPYGYGTVSSADATSFSGFYLALQPSTGQNPATDSADWMQLSVAPGFVDESYLQNPPYSFADAWSAAKSYTANQIVSVPYSGTLQSLAPYDPSLNPETYLSVPIYMTTCKTDTTIAAENQALYSAVQAVGGTITLQVINDGTCSHQSADLFFPSTFASFFDQYRKASPSVQAGTPAPAGTPTTTVLTVNSAGAAASTVDSGSTVTLTAAVSAGGAPVTAGQVNFCDPSAPACSGASRVGTAQLTNAGTALLHLVPAIGNHAYTAVFTGAGGAASSSSPAVSLNVAGLHSTVTAVAASGSAGHYALTATVSGAAQSSVPTGTVSFVDASAGNRVLGTATLGTAAPMLNWTEAPAPATGAGPSAVVTADLNGDGKPDLAVVNSQSHSVTILLGNGDGTFVPAPSPDTGSVPVALVAGDFNGDGKTDLAVANSQSNSVTILLGNGDGTFTAAPTLASGTHPAAMAAGDFNGDGNLDLVVANSGDNTLSIFLGKGDGSFAVAPVAHTGCGPDSIAVGDFNGDGALDLAVANGSDNTLSLLRGNGDGTFTAAASPSTGGQPVAVAAADLNGDGILDLAVVNQGDATVTVLLGNGDATFAAGSVLPAGTGPASLAVADLNGDGNLDLAVAASGSAQVIILLGNGDGTFVPVAAGPAAGSNANAMAAADFNSGGWPDLAITSFSANSVSIALTQVSAPVAATVTDISPMGMGSHQVQASYSGDAVFGASASSPVALTAQPVAPVLTWEPPAAIVYGTPLGGAELNASSAVAGSFAYTPAAGTVLSAGTHTLSVAFTPSDGTDYTTVTATVTLVVNAATPAITWATPAAIPYGTPLSALQLNASSATPGSFVYTPAAGAVLAAGAQTLSATFIPTDSTNFTTAAATVPLVVDKAAQSISLAPLASALTFGAAPVALSASASSGLAVSFSAAGPGSLSGGTLTLTGAGVVTVTASQPGDSNYLAAPSVSAVIQVKQAASTTTLTASAASVDFGTPVTFTATVGSGAGVPSGQVSFLNGTTVLGTAPLNSGTATLTVASLPAGSSSVTAAYSGDSNFSVSTSPAVPVTVTAAVVDFSVSASPTSRSVYMGQSASYTLTITPTGGFHLPVTLTCSQLPAAASCSFTPVSAGSSGTSTLVVQTTASGSGLLASLARSGSKGMAFAVLLPLFLPLRLRWRKRWPALLALFALLGAGALSGCGGTMALASGTPTGVQTVTVAVTANNGAQTITHEAGLTLDVLPPQ